MIPARSLRPLASSAVTTPPDPDAESAGESRPVYVFGHRGVPGPFPENTLPSFAAAFAAGADGVECDVRLTRDGQLVICHDDTLTRTTDRPGTIAELDLDEIRRADAGAQVPAFAGTGVQIPLLDELLDLIAERPTRLVNLEIKSPAGDYGHASDGATGAAVARRVAERGLLGRVVMSSFNARELVAATAAVPAIGTALLILPGSDVADVLARHPGMTGAHPPVSAFRSELAAATMQALREHSGGWSGVWTVNDPDDAAHLARLGVDALIGDDPAMLRAIAGPAPEGSAG